MSKKRVSFAATAGGNRRVWLEESAVYIRIREALVLELLCLDRLSEAQVAKILGLAR